MNEQDRKKKNLDFLLGSLTHRRAGDFYAQEDFLFQVATSEL